MSQGLNLPPLPIWQLGLLLGMTGVEPAAYCLGELQPIVTLCQSEVR